MDLKEVGLLGGDQQSHWYYASKGRALMRALGGRTPVRILDVGAGSGFFSKALLRDTSAKSAICVDRGYTGEWSEIHFTKPITFCRASPVGDADLVLLMDVLEHVDDDIALLHELARSAKPNTRFVVSVPAFSWLWSKHDEFLEHRRRYTLNSVRSLLSGVGLVPVGGFYMFAGILPAVALKRLWDRWRARTASSDLRPHRPLTNTMLTWICAAESTMARHNRAFGLTVFAVAEKR